MYPGSIEVLLPRPRPETTSLQAVVSGHVYLLFSDVHLSHARLEQLADLGQIAYRREVAPMEAVQPLLVVLVLFLCEIGEVLDVQKFCVVELEPAGNDSLCEEAREGWGP